MRSSAVKIKLKKFLTGHLGVQSVWNPHQGIELYHDIASFLPALRIDTIFDVGANVGAVAIDYSHWFPDASIYSFEPSTTVFRQLENNTKSRPSIKCVNCALGSSSKTGYLTIHESESYLNRIVENKNQRCSANAVEQVEIVTLDEFCLTHGIDHIDLLKIDTEGSDYAVLEGVSTMLESQRISLVQVECGMHPENDLHVPMEKVKRHFESIGYNVFGLYEQTGEWIAKRGYLRRVDAVFVAKSIA